MTQLATATLIDPPWAYRNFSLKAHGAAAAHYTTMGLADLQQLPVGQWTDQSGHLFTWFTWPKMAQAVRLVEDSWGYKHCTVIPWIKVTPTTEEIKRGVGFWTMGCSEGLQIAKRGKPSRSPRAGKEKPMGLLIDGGPDPYAWDTVEDYQREVRKHLEERLPDDPEHVCAFCCERSSAVFYHERGKRHSQKPLDIHGYIERYCDGPFMELFATATRPGWGCYGRDTGWEITPHGIVPAKEASVTWAQEIVEKEPSTLAVVDPALDF